MATALPTTDAATMEPMRNPSSATMTAASGLMFPLLAAAAVSIYNNSIDTCANKYLYSITSIASSFDGNIADDVVKMLNTERITGLYLFTEAGLLRVTSDMNLNKEVHLRSELRTMAGQTHLQTNFTPYEADDWRFSAVPANQHVAFRTGIARTNIPDVKVAEANYAAALYAVLYLADQNADDFEQVEDIEEEGEFTLPRQLLALTSI